MAAAEDLEEEGEGEEEEESNASEGASGSRLPSSRRHTGRHAYSLLGEEAATTNLTDPYDAATDDLVEGEGKSATPRARARSPLANDLDTASPPRAKRRGGKFCFGLCDRSLQSEANGPPHDKQPGCAVFVCDFLRSFLEAALTPAAAMAAARVAAEEEPDSANASRRRHGGKFCFGLFDRAAA